MLVDPHLELRAIQEALTILTNPATRQQWIAYVEEFTDHQKRLLISERSKTYGVADSNLARLSLTSGDRIPLVSLDMIAAKIARERYVHMYDNTVDGANYFLIHQFVYDRFELLGMHWDLDIGGSEGEQMRGILTTRLSELLDDEKVETVVEAVMGCIS